MASKSSGPLVSVVVPAYNYGHLIAETLGSLTAQTYGDWECVVVDDGSTDETAEVVGAIAAHDRRVRYVRQENGRQAAARNNGIGRSRGEYFQFLDADDLIEPHKLKRQVECLERDPSVDLVYCGVRYFGSGGGGSLAHSRGYSVWDDGRPWMPEVSGRGRALLAKLLLDNIMVVNAPLVRRRVVEAVGGFDGRLTPVEDWDYWTRAAAAGFSFRYEDAAGARALVRAHELSASRDGRRMFRATLRMRRAWASSGLLEEAEDLRLNRRLIAECEGLLGVEEAMRGNRSRGALRLLKAAALDGRARRRARWLACALLSPFATAEQLKGAATSSFKAAAAGRLHGKR